MYFLLWRQNYCSYALLNTRNGKLGLLRIGAVYLFFLRVQKLDELALLEGETLPIDVHVGGRAMQGRLCKIL